MLAGTVVEMFSRCVFAMIEDDLRARLAVPVEPSISERR